TAGQFDMIHAEPVDRRTSSADAVIYGYTGGIFVNGRAERFYDEGRDTWDNTFEHIGFEIWRNQDQEAYWIADAKTLAIPGWESAVLSDVPPERADTIGDLARRLGHGPPGLGDRCAPRRAARARRHERRPGPPPRPRRRGAGEDRRGVHRRVRPG